MTEFRIGDRVERFQGGSHDYMSQGETGVVVGVTPTAIDVKMDMNGAISKGHSPENLRILLSIDSSNQKSQPIKLHLVLVNSCKNFVGVRSSYQEAVELAKSRSEAVTVYELKEVANVTTQRIVKKMDIKKK